MFSYGFYDAIDEDRVYSATQFGEMFDGLITDGIYATIGNAFAVVPGMGVQVKVRSGRAWFNKRWSVNTADLPLDLTVPDLLLPRIDAVILEVDTRVFARKNAIKVVTGEPNVNPTKPILTRADGLYQYPLAWVRVDQNVEAIAPSKIENNIGKTPTPFVTGILKSITIDELWNQWEGQFDEWFTDLQAQLSGDVAVNLQNQINALKTGKVNVSDKATTANAQNGTNDTQWMTPLKTNQHVDARLATASDILAGTSSTKLVTPAGLLNGGIGLFGLFSSIQKIKIVTFYKAGTTAFAPSDLVPNSYGLVFCVGGGGGGGGAALAGSSTYMGVGGGGGGGGHLSYGLIKFSGNATVTVGNGGSGGEYKKTSGTSVQGSYGGSGGQSSVIVGSTTISAAGGGGGQGGYAYSTGSAHYGSGGNGGSGGGGGGYISNFTGSVQIYDLVGGNGETFGGGGGHKIDGHGVNGEYSGSNMSVFPALDLLGGLSQLTNSSVVFKLVGDPLIKGVSSVDTNRIGFPGYYNKVNYGFISSTHNGSSGGGGAFSLGSGGIFNTTCGGGGGGGFNASGGNGGSPAISTASGGGGGGGGGGVTSTLAYTGGAGAPGFVVICYATK